MRHFSKFFNTVQSSESQNKLDLSVQQISLTILISCLWLLFFTIYDSHMCSRTASVISLHVFKIMPAEMTLVFQSYDDEQHAFHPLIVTHLIVFPSTNITTVFEIHPKMSHLKFLTFFDRNFDIFGIFHQLLATKDVKS